MSSQSPPVQSPTPASRKRLRADSESPATDESASRPLKGRRHTRNADAAVDVAEAIRFLSNSMKPTNAPNGPPSTPERRQAAIHLMEDDGEFSEDEEVLAIQLFTRDSASADSYLGIRKKSTRTKFIRSQLAL